MPSNEGREPATIESLESPTNDLLKTCAFCGTVANHTRTCRTCWSDLNLIPALKPGEADVWRTSEQARLTKLRRLQRVRRSLFIVAALTLSILYYFTFIRVVPPPPLEPSTALTMDGKSGGWSRTNGTVAWNTNLGATVVTDLVANEDIVYVPLSDARVVALSVQNGQELWSVPVPGQLDSSPVISGDRVFMGLRSGVLTALDAVNGTEIWSTDTGHNLFTSLLVHDGIVWATTKRQVLGLDAADGTIIWTRTFDSHAVGAAFGPVSAGDRIAAYTGEQIEIFESFNGAQTTYLKVPRVKYVTTSGTSILAQSRAIIVSLDSHSLRPWWEGMRRVWRVFNIWNFAPPPPPPPHNWVVDPPSRAFPLTANDERLLVASHGGIVRSYWLADGDLTWEQSLPAITAAPVLTPDGLIVAHGEELSLLDPKTGLQLQSRTLGDGLVVKRITTSSSGTYIVTDSNDIVALR